VTYLEESAALLETLRGQRAHVLGSLDGLSDVDLRRAVLPSGWHALGVVQHLALDVERFWFRAVAAGERVELRSGDEAWQVPSDMPASEILDLYRREADLADAIVSRTPLDAVAAWWPAEFFGDAPPRSLRRTILHVITETATHAGHLDAVRELIDGRTWLIMTDS
jgi:hypothetical protein